MLNLIKEKDDIDKVYLYVKDLSEPKSEFLIKKRENVGIKHLNDPSVFTKHTDTMDDVFEDINEYNSARKRKMLIVFGDMIIDVMINKIFQAIIKGLFIRCRKRNLSLVFITQSYFSVPREVRLNSTY